HGHRGQRLIEARHHATRFAGAPDDRADGYRSDDPFGGEVAGPPSLSAGHITADGNGNDPATDLAVVRDGVERRGRVPIAAGHAPAHTDRPDVPARREDGPTTRPGAALNVPGHG